jgi:hypothetical protein
LIVPGERPALDIIMDSGAFSAWKSGKPVDINKYCAYLHANKHWIETYIALDEIIPDDPERAAKISFDNYLEMRKQGLSPMPVFHGFEDIKWLYKLVDAGADYIGLAGLSLNSHTDRTAWYSHIFNEFTDGEGRPLVKFHALGDSRYDVLSRFPWYSADSTRWLYLAALNATIPIEQKRKVALRNDHMNDSTYADIDKLEGFNLDFFRTHLARHGVNPAGFAERGKISYSLSIYLALLYYLEQEKTITALCPISHKRNGFMWKTETSGEGLHIPELKYYSVATVHTNAWSCIAYSGARRALVSYFYVQDTKKDDLNKVSEWAHNPNKFCAEHESTREIYNILTEYVTK